MAPLIREISLQALSISRGKDLIDNGVRADQSAIWVCDLPSVRHKTVIVAAPVNHYLAAVQEVPPFSDALHSYTSEHLIPSEEFYEGMMSEFRKGKIEKDLVARELFAPYARWGSFTAKNHSPFGKRFPGLELDRRLISSLVPYAAADEVVRYFETLFTQASAAALIAGAEELSAMTAAAQFSEIPDRSSVHYESKDYNTFARTVFQKDEGVLIVERLRDILKQLRAGRGQAVDLFPLHKAKIVPNIYVRRGTPSGDIAWEVALLRSEVVAELDWLWHYPGTLRMRHDLAERKGEYADDCSMVIEQIDRNLGDFIRSAETTMPVLCSNPMARATP